MIEHTEAISAERALKLALEALENSVDLVREDAYEAEKLYGNYPTRQGKVNGLKVLADDHEKAITALREALAEQPAQHPSDEDIERAIGYRLPKHSMEALRKLMAEQPAPVAEPRKQKPVCIGWDDKTDTPIMGYTSPPAQRTWVGLTDEERNECTQTPFTADQHRAIEAKLKEKNSD